METLAPYSNARYARPGKNGKAARKPKPQSGAELADLRGQLEAIKKVQAVIEFELDGTVITANDNFLKTLGYRLEEIQGQHHSLFVEPAYRASNEYRQFWNDLAAGKFQAAEYKPHRQGAERKSGFRRATIRFLAWTASRSRW